MQTSIMIQQLLILLLVAIAECSPQVGLFGGLNGRAWRVVSTKSVKPVYRADAKREIVRYGPLELVAKDVSKYFVYMVKSY